MKSILYLPTRFFPSISGAEFYFQRMAEIISIDYKFKIDIFTSNAIDFKALRNEKGKTIKPQDKYYSKVNHLNIKRFPVNYDASEKDILKRLKAIPTFDKLDLNEECLKIFIKNGPYLEDLLIEILNTPNLDYDLIHTTFFPYFNCIISLIVGTFINKPVVCTPFFHFSNPRYLDFRLTEVLKKFDLIIACTNLEREFLIKKCSISPSKIKVVPLGVDYDKFKITNKTSLRHDSFKQKFFNRKERNYKLILFCGYKNYEKGAISILKSIPSILKKIKNIYFVFIGPSTIAFNSELSKISKLEKLRVINFTPENLSGYYDKKKLAVFKEADIYLMPSRSDAFGISFLEAWSAGKPVIGARTGATPEVVREGIDGLLVEFDNPEDIAEKVIYLLKNKRLRKKLGSAGQLKVYQKYTWENIAKETVKIYKNLKKY